MHRRPLIELLRRYAGAHAGERPLVARFAAFVDGHADCLLRSCAEGHITASAWIVDAAGRCLLTHHRKLGKWLQLGGHVDGTAAGAVPLPLDLDVHPIPQRGDEPEHLHWDVRFLLQSLPGQQLAISAESNQLRWFTAAELWAVTDEDSVLRLQRKAAPWLQRR